jgi:hypothetical protein
MPAAKFIVDLTKLEEEQLRKFISHGTVSARRAARASCSKPTRD